MPGLPTARAEPVTPAGRTACAIIDSLSGYLADQAAANDRAGSFAAASVRRLREAGVLAACVPVSAGGLGLESLYDLTVLTSRMAAADASVATAVFMHLSLSWYYARTVRCVSDLPLDAAQRTWVREIGGGQMIVCSAVAEPGVTPVDLVSTAVRCESGWIINGRKILASISPGATHFYTRLKVETSDGPMLGTAMIPASAGGVRALDDWDGLGLRGSGSGQVTFTNVTVPAGIVSLRGPWGERENDQATEGKSAVAGPLLAIPLGIAEAARSIALTTLAGDAKIAGRRRSDTVSTVRALIAEMELKLASARATLRATVLDIDAKVTNAAPRSLSAATSRELMRGCVTAGITVERAAAEVVDMAMQLCGGSSYSAGHPLARMCRDVRAAMFMRPRAPAEEWTDFLVECALSDQAGPLA